MPNYFNGFPNMGYQAQQMMQQAPQGVTMIDVRSEDEMMRYPVAPGTSVYFRNVTEPVIYIKTMASQYGQPVVEKFRRVDEQAAPAPEYALKSDLDALAAMVASLGKKAKKDE